MVVLQPVTLRKMSDGAAFVLVMSEEMVKELNLAPIARL
jgi:acetyl-CoA acyltransferase